jgi:GNAT superfamily N-acetyltransferase
VGSLLGRIPSDNRRRLTEAMRTVQQILRDEQRASPSPRVTLRGPRPGDLGWAVERNAAVYAAEFGWNEEYETLVAGIIADFAASHDPKREAVWIAELDGERAGCVFCVGDKAPDTARLRLLLVDPAARGHGIGGRLVEECVAFARAAHYTEMVLWTNDVLSGARRIYQRVGFELVAEQGHHSFGHELVGQDWRLAL